MNLLEVRTYLAVSDLETFSDQYRQLINLIASFSVPLFRAGMLPPLYGGSIVFRQDVDYGQGIENLLPPQVIAARGYGDCDQLATYRIGELLAAGCDASATLADWSGTGEIHAQVRLPGGEVEDPSIILGAPTTWPNWFLYDKGK